MLTAGVLARFDTAPGSDAAVQEFFEHGLAVVEGQPSTTLWFAFRIDDSTYGAFAAFATEEDRAALLAAGGPVASVANAHLFVRPPTFELVDMVEARVQR